MSEETIAHKYVVVFDWGNTLMEVNPEYSGPMASWPQVNEIPEAIEALEKLRGRHTMVVATNASDSNAALVWKALQRAGMGEYFKAVFTSKELGSQKPAAGFFRQVESVIASPPYQMVMVGDSYTHDMLGAKAAGWRAVWYNPGRQAAPGSLPLHDSELGHLADLPETLEQLALPDYPTCMSWLQERDTPYNILAHVQMVAAAAYLMAVWLSEQGIVVDPLLTHRGGLLHDLGKIDSIRLDRERGSQHDHASIAYEMLLARRQPVLAEIANRHMIYHDPAYARRPRSWEEKLVNFADKLVEDNNLVPIQERTAALQKRYPQYAANIERSLPVLAGLEQEICVNLKTSPAELISQLKSALGV